MAEEKLVHSLEVTHLYILSTFSVHGRGGVVYTLSHLNEQPTALLCRLSIGGKKTGEVETTQTVACLQRTICLCCQFYISTCM